MSRENRNFLLSVSPASERRGLQPQPRARTHGGKLLQQTVELSFPQTLRELANGWEGGVLGVKNCRAWNPDARRVTLAARSAQAWLGRPARPRAQPGAPEDRRCPHLHLPPAPPFSRGKGRHCAPPPKSSSGWLQ